MEKVIVIISGGAVQDVIFDKVKTCQVEIHDYDLDNVDVESLLEDPNCGWDFQKDEDGDYYQNITYTPEGV